MADDPGLSVRHAAALKLLRSGMETDGLLLLSYVVWPTPAAAVLSETDGATAAETAVGVAS